MDWPATEQPERSDDNVWERISALRNCMDLDRQSAQTVGEGSLIKGKGSQAEVSNAMKLGKEIENHHLRPGPQVAGKD